MYQKSWSYAILFLRYDTWGCNYFSFWAIFCPFTSPNPFNSPKNQNFTKVKKVLGDIIIFHICTKNYNQMKHGSWDTVCDRRTDGKSEIQRWVPHLKILLSFNHNYWLHYISDLPHKFFFQIHSFRILHKLQIFYSIKKLSVAYMQSCQKSTNTDVA